ncbi:hypothetical protein KY359_01950 [Candidatus Woesearchaeota archaeon]|nr:hypothetical protein [Candidatus Woesearchaeota archaeon]
MPGINSIFEKIGSMIGIKMPAKKAGAPQSAGAAKPVPEPGGKKPFDFNMYIKAWGIFFDDFFKKKVPYFFKNIGPVFKEFPIWWGKQKQDEQIAYALLILGNVMFIMGIVMFIVL